MNPNTFTTPISLDEGNKSSGKGSVSPKKLKKPKIISGYTRLSGRTIESDSFSEDIYEGTQESIPSFQELIEQAVIDRTALSTENTPEITLKTKYTKQDTKQNTKQIKASVITKTRNLTAPYNYEQEVKISLSEEGEKRKQEMEERQKEEQITKEFCGKKFKISKRRKIKSDRIKIKNGRIAIIPTTNEIQGWLDEMRKNIIAEQEIKGKQSKTSSGSNKTKWITGGLVVAALTTVGVVGSMQKGKKKEITSGANPTPIVNTETIKTAEKQTSRHTVLESDPIVQYLKKLEEKYKDNAAELAKVMAIKVHPESIEFSSVGLKLKRKNESITIKKSVIDKYNEREEEYIWQWAEAYSYKGNIWLNWYQATKRYGSKIPSSEQWGKIFDAIPGNSDATYVDNIKNILSIQFTGGRLGMGQIYGFGSAAYFWSSTKDKKDEYGDYVIYEIINNKGVKKWSGYAADARSVRLLAD